MTRIALRTAAVAVLLSLTACEAGASSPPRPTAGSTPATSESPTTVLTAPTYRLAPMPVTPTWQPDGEVARPEFASSGWEVSYQTAGLSILVTYEDPYRDPPPFDVHPEGDGTPITMLDLSGRQHVGVIGDSDPYTLWVVRDDGGQSVMVWGDDAALVERLAEGLRWQPIPPRPPFKLTLLPDDFVPSHMSGHKMEFVASGDNSLMTGEPSLYVAVVLWKSYEFERDPAAVATTVNGNAAEVVVTKDRAFLLMTLPDGRVLQVDSHVMLGLDQSDLERIAGGITVTKDAVAWTNNI